MYFIYLHKLHSSGIIVTAICKREPKRQTQIEEFKLATTVLIKKHGIKIQNKYKLNVICHVASMPSDMNQSILTPNNLPKILAFPFLLKDR